MVKLTVTGPYTEKDQRKATVADKFIGRGSARSSTAVYARDFGWRANSGRYNHDHIVFISAEGARSGRLDPDFVEIERAMLARATILTDNQAARERPYNVGERQVAKFLTNHGYYVRETNSYGIWKPRTISE